MLVPKFFLVSPELARLHGESQQMAGVSSSMQIPHHALSTSVLMLQEKTFHALTTNLRSFTHLFTEECGELFNFVTKAGLAEKVKKDEWTISSKRLD